MSKEIEKIAKHVFKDYKDEIFNKYLVVLDSYMELLDTMKEDL